MSSLLGTSKSKDETHTLSDAEDLKEQQQMLAAVIKGHHKQLRRKYRENGGDHESVWDQHLQDIKSLQHYAQAMHNLATHHWSAHPETRVTWCRKIAIDYYIQGGIQLALEKDARRQKRRTQKFCEGSEKSTQSTDLTAQSVKCQGEKSDHQNVGCTDAAEIAYTYQGISGAERLRLLDVGSCYNPFLQYPEFETVGVDLSPATESVYQCDFLHLRVTEPSQQPPTSHSAAISKQITELPGSSFHIVVFSLLLEYLPASAQRWTCCKTAASLLVKHGLLLVITPDSNSQHRNAPMMKSWRQALEYLGFERWKYEKMEHVHCVAFRKVMGESSTIPDTAHSLLYIPQDFSDACYWDDHLPESLRANNVTQATTEEDESKREELQNFLLTSAEELPMMGLDDEENG